jgi:hypothetical protein
MHFNWATKVVPATSHPFATTPTVSIFGGGNVTTTETLGNKLDFFIFTNRMPEQPMSQVQRWRQRHQLFSASAGATLSTLRAEGASRLQLLLDLSNQLSTPLLVFVDCLVRVARHSAAMGASDIQPAPGRCHTLRCHFPFAQQALAADGPGAASEGEKPHGVPVK